MPDNPIPVFYNFNLKTILNRVKNCSNQQATEIPIQSQFDQAQELFSNPLKDDGSGIQAVRKIISDARQLGRFSSGDVRDDLFAKADDAGSTLDQLIAEIEAGNEEKAKQTSDELETKVKSLMESIENGSVHALASEFTDTTSSLKQLTAATKSGNSHDFERKSRDFENQSGLLIKSRLDKTR